MDGGRLVTAHRRPPPPPRRWPWSHVAIATGAATGLLVAPVAAWAQSAAPAPAVDVTADTPPAHVPPVQRTAVASLTILPAPAVSIGAVPGGHSDPGKGPSSVVTISAHAVPVSTPQTTTPRPAAATTEAATRPPATLPTATQPPPTQPTTPAASTDCASVFVECPSDHEHHLTPTPTPTAKPTPTSETPTTAAPTETTTPSTEPTPTDLPELIEELLTP